MEELIFSTPQSKTNNLALKSMQVAACSPINLFVFELATVMVELLSIVLVSIINCLIDKLENMDVGKY